MEFKKKNVCFFHLCLGPFTPLCHAVERMCPIPQQSKWLQCSGDNLKKVPKRPNLRKWPRTSEVLRSASLLSPQFSQNSPSTILGESHLSLSLCLASIFFHCSLQWESLSWKPACSPSVMPSLEVDGVLSAAQPDRTTGAIFIRGKANINK